MKRIISFFLAAVMCCSLLPAAVSGEIVSTSDTAQIDKIAFSTLEALASKGDDELVAVNLWLRGPSDGELEAMTPMEKPGSDATSEERNAYASAYAQTKETVYSGIMSAFARKYLDETEQVLQEAYGSAPGIGVYVHKSKLAALAALDEVIWINKIGRSIILVEEPAPEEKIAEPLRAYIAAQAPDKEIPVRIWLRGPSVDEFRTIVSADYPTLSSPPEAFQAYRTASEQAANELGNDLFMYRLFMDKHREDFGTVLYESDVDFPVMVATVRADKIESLAALKMVSLIDAAFGYDEALPDPELPEDPAQRKKIEKQLQKFMNIAGHDELIPIHITLKEPADIAVLSADQGDRAAQLEAQREAYTALTNEFVEKHLEPTDKVFFKGKLSPFVTAEVAKHKIAGLAALDEVTSVDWALGHDDEIFSDDGKDYVYVTPLRESQPPIDPAVYDKLSSALAEYMEGKADDAMIPIAVYLDHPSSAEIEAMVPISQPDVYSTVTMQEVNAYISARNAVAWEVFSAITTAFVENHLDENDTIRYRGKVIPVVNCNVPKSKVLSLAALEEVTQIGYFPNVPLYPTWIRDDSEAAKKLTEPLKAYMENLADDEPVTVCVDLHMPSEEIMERLVSVPKPGEDASQQEIDAYNAAYQEKWREQVALRTDAFVNHSLSGSEQVPVYYIGQDAATVICEVPVRRIKDLAFWQEITQIDLAGDHGETGKNALAKAIVAAQTLDLDKYTEESAAGLKEQLEIAKYILVKADATQEEIDAAANALNDLIQSLTISQPIKRDLAELIADAGTIDLIRYTEESAALFEVEFEKARYILAKEDATQAEIDAAYMALEDAIAGLIKIHPPEPPQFEDVCDPKTFYYDAVYWAYNADPQITRGISQILFAPDEACTRGQVVTFLWRAAGEPEPTTVKTGFNDLKPGAFYEKPVAWAVEQGITKGMNDTTFAPDATCTRGQIVTFLWRFRGSPAPERAETAFTDLKPGASYEKAVAWAVENEVTNGMTDTTFVPDGTCTRAQVVTFLYRTMTDE